MKKKRLKLGLNKVNVSNLSSIRGGNGRSDVATCLATISRNFIDLCCPIFGTDECAGSQNTHCGGGDETGNCLTHEETCVCFLTTWGEPECEQ